MDSIKKILGIVWLLLAAYCAYFSVAVLGIPKVLSDSLDDKVFGWIIVVVLTPIIVGGLAIFGWYSLTGEYREENM